MFTPSNPKVKTAGSFTVYPIFDKPTYGYIDVGEECDTEDRRYIIVIPSKEKIVCPRQGQMYLAKDASTQEMLLIPAQEFHVENVSKEKLVASLTAFINNLLQYFKLTDESPKTPKQKTIEVNIKDPTGIFFPWKLTYNKTSMVITIECMADGEDLF